MKKETLWYGYLNAGQKSTPILLDHELPTNNGETVYLFNLMRGEILEYQRQVVEAKLQELNVDEQSEIINQLKEAYTKARRNFKPRGARGPQSPDEYDPLSKNESTGKTLEDLTGFIERDDDGGFIEEEDEEEDWFDKSS